MKTNDVSCTKRSIRKHWDTGAGHLLFRVDREDQHVSLRVDYHSVTDPYQDSRPRDYPTMPLLAMDAHFALCLNGTPIGFIGQSCSVQQWRDGKKPTYYPLCNEHVAVLLHRPPEHILNFLAGKLRKEE